MRVLVYAYLNNNLGDDLFVDILVKRYPEKTFTIINTGKADLSFLEKYRNVKIRKINFFYKLVNNIGSKIGNEFSYYKYLSKKHDVFLMIGGSMFIENRGWEKKLSQWFSMSKFCNKSCLLGANFGPYKDEEFFCCHREWFSSLSLITFRDKKSYSLFDDLPQVRYASDIVLNYQFNEDEVIEPSYQSDVLISVCNFKNNHKIACWYELYVQSLTELCRTLLMQKKKIVLLGMCPSEGDGDVINQITKGLSHQELAEINPVLYHGDIETTLRYFRATESIVATRFHSMILGFLFHKKVTPIIYSEKMTNVLNDISFTSKYYALDAIANIELNTLSFVYPEEYKAAATMHFKFFDLLCDNRY